MLPKYSWMCGLPVDHGQLDRSCTQRSMFSPLPSADANNPTASKGTLCPPPLYTLEFGPCWACRSFLLDVTVTANLYVQLSSSFLKNVSLLSSWSLLLSLFLLWSLSFQGGRKGVYVPFSVECSTLSYSDCTTHYSCSLNFYLHCVVSVSWITTLMK